MSGKRELKSIEFKIMSGIAVFRVTANDDSFIDLPYDEVCEFELDDIDIPQLVTMSNECLQILNGEYNVEESEK